MSSLHGDSAPFPRIFSAVPLSPVPGITHPSLTGIRGAGKEVFTELDPGNSRTTGTQTTSEEVEEQQSHAMPSFPNASFLSLEMLSAPAKPSPFQTRGKKRQLHACPRPGASVSPHCTHLPVAPRPTVRLAVGEDWQ